MSDIDIDYDAVETLTEKEACEWLYATAAVIPSDEVIVELGVYRGGSLRYLTAGAGAGDGARVYGVDPWAMTGAYPTRPHMLERYLPEDMEIAATLAPEATLIRNLAVNSGRAWDGPDVGLLVIDAEHRKNSVLADFSAWEPHFSTAGTVVAFDDYCPRFPGVVEAVDQLVSNGRITPFRIVGSRLFVAVA